MAIKELSNVQIKSGNDWYKLCPFPIGFIYLSQNRTSPASTFGGSWSALNEDRYLLPSAEWTTYGSKTITVKNLPPHTHTTQFDKSSNTLDCGYGAWFYGGFTEPRNPWPTGSTGGGEAYWPQSRKCYGWYRTA